MKMKLSTSIYDLVLIYVCHFHHHFLLQLPLVKFDHYRGTRAFILDPCIQGISYSLLQLHMVLISSGTKTNVVIYYQITWETATIFTTTTNATTIVTFPSVTKITFFIASVI